MAQLSPPTANAVSPGLSAVLFLVGRYRQLSENASPYRVDEELDGVLEALQFANSFVLNDVTVVGGLFATSLELAENGMERFLKEELAKGTVETAGYGRQYSFDIQPYDAAVDLPAVLEQIESAGEGAGHGPLGEAARVLQQTTFILLADALTGCYVPERLYGMRALEKYPHIAAELRHKHVANFKVKFEEKLNDLPPVLNGLAVQTPCFLTEALRNTHSPDGVWKTLREIRDSRAARRYRKLMGIVIDEMKPGKERIQAAEELAKDMDAAFSGDGLASRVPLSVKLTVGLSAGAVAVLVPAVALLGLLPVAVEAGDAFDQWLRRRANLFEHLSRAAETDLYAELRRVFGNIHFDAGHLQHFLRNKDFGWSDELWNRLYRRWT